MRLQIGIRYRPLRCKAVITCCILVANVLSAQNVPLNYKNTSVNVDLLRLIRSRAIKPEVDHTLPAAADGRERYHWQSLFLQSFEFNAIESVWRIASDDQIRGLIANKPYWYDYAASMRQFNMGRWNDGDPFMVNYVGHSLQGAVAGYLQIQNDPGGRALQISNSREYWKSRSLAMLWSTIYSTQSEIGPLGEAALGNEGGWTYPRGFSCPRPCSDFRPGIDTYTNNTGWVDFIVTPVVGTLWIVAEDTLDMVLMKAYEKHDVDSRHLGPRILRASLNPSRSFANMLRVKQPWYRDWEHSNNSYGPAIHFVKADEVISEQRNRPRLEISPHFTFLSIAVNKPGCHNCREGTTGTGLEISYRLTQWLDLDMNLGRHVNASPLPSDRAGGDLYSGLFGIRTGLEGKRYALKLAIRPGFIRFDHAYLTSPVPGDAQVPEIGAITHFAWNAALSGDYRIGRNFALRGTLGQTLVRYRTANEDPPGIGTVPYLSWLSHENFINRGNWVFEVGPVFRLGAPRRE